MPQQTIAFRASIFHFKDLARGSSDHAYEYIKDGLLVVEDGLVKEVGPFSSLGKTLPPESRLTDYSGRIIMPGFVDTHIHYPQTDIIASCGKQLLGWLQEYTYPAEMKFRDRLHCKETAEFFFDELLRNGTTCALVLPTVHMESVQALFETADSRRMRIVSGKIMMDCNAPPGLLDTTEQCYQDMKLIIDRWHMKNRLSCAVIPRFALTSSEEQLLTASDLIKETPSLVFHTHLSENKDEVDAIARRFPWSRSYLDVYDHYGLTGARSVFAHGIHLVDRDYKRLSGTGSSIALCPTSNLFLGSGLFHMENLETHNIKTSLGTDVGAGTSFSMFKTMAETYKICQLQGYSLSPAKAFYMATLGGAEILGLDDKVGNFGMGKEADFIVIDPGRIPILERRIANSCHLEEILFALIILGDDRIIEHCHILGEDLKPSPAQR